MSPHPRGTPPDPRREPLYVVDWWQVLAIAAVQSLRDGELGSTYLEAAALRTLGSVGDGVASVGNVAGLGLRAGAETIKLGALARGVGKVGGLAERGVTSAYGQGRSLAYLLCCGEETPSNTRFIVLFRSRRAAALCVAAARWPGELLTKPGYVRVEPAPSPPDAYWPNLLKPKLRAQADNLLSIGLTVALFLLYNIPVGFVQSIASIRELSKIQALSWLANLVKQAGPQAVATFEGFLSSLVLQIFTYLTLYSGLFQWLVILRGAQTHTTITSHATARMMLFQLVFVLLVSVIISSLWDSVQRLAQNPTELPYLLAGYLPLQSTFFIHYVLNGVLFVAIFDMLQFFPLLSYLLQACCCRCASWRVEEPHEEMVIPEPYKEEDKRQRLAIIYAKLVLILGIVLVFNITNPLVPFMGLLYFLPAYPLYALLFLNVFGAPEVDTAGEVWEQAIRYETWTLLIAQTLVFGILTLKSSPVGAIAAGAAVIYTARRTYLLRRRYSGLASCLPLQQTTRLDDAAAAARPAAGPLEGFWGFSGGAPDRQAAPPPAAEAYADLTAYSNSAALAKGEIAQSEARQ